MSGMCDWPTSNSLFCWRDRSWTRPESAYSEFIWPWLFVCLCVCVFCLLKFYFSFNSFDYNLLVRTVKISYGFFCVCWTRMAGWDLKECFWEKDWRPLTFTMATCISRRRHMRQGQQDCSSAGCQQLQLLMLKATWRRHNDAEEVIWCSVSVLGHLFCVHL